MDGRRSERRDGREVERDGDDGDGCGMKDVGESTKHDKPSEKSKQCRDDARQVF